MEHGISSEQTSGICGTPNLLYGFLTVESGPRLTTHQHLDIFGLYGSYRCPHGFTASPYSSRSGLCTVHAYHQDCQANAIFHQTSLTKQAPQTLVTSGFWKCQSRLQLQFAKQQMEGTGTVVQCVLFAIDAKFK